MGSFPKDIMEERFNRQQRKCALCNKDITFENYDYGTRGAWHAHHIDGDQQNNNLSNCACVCINDPENCHLNIAHGGDFTSGTLASRSEFCLNR